MPALASSSPRSPASVAGLRVSALSKSFPGTRALDDVSFAVARGSVHSLMGGNGSGKSTLIKILAGVEVGDPGGIVALGEHEIASDRINPLWSAHAGLRVVHQDLGLFDTLSVAENLFAGLPVPRRFGRLDWARVRREAQSDLDARSISVRAADTLGTLRASERTLVAIARALHETDGVPPPLLVLDEPTARLPPEEVSALLAALLRYAEQGRTILYVSHRLEEVLELGGEVTVLRDGRLVTTRSTAGLGEAALVELMVGHAAALEAPRLARRQGDPLLAIRGLESGPLRKVDLTVRSGEVVGVCGLVGSGRTHLLEAIFGQRPRSGGEIELDGRVLPPSDVRTAIRRGVSFVPEDRLRDGVFVNLGLPENISASDPGRYWRKLVFRHSAERADAARAIATFKIRASSVTATMHTLSGGNQQKALLARWILGTRGCCCRRAHAGRRCGGARGHPRADRSGRRGRLRGSARLIRPRRADPPRRSRDHPRRRADRRRQRRSGDRPPLARAAHARLLERGRTRGMSETALPAATKSTAHSQRRDAFVSILERYALVWLLVLMCLFFALDPSTSKVFISVTNIRTIAANEAVTGLVALAALLPLVAMRFDVSVGAVLGGISVFVAYLTVNLHWPLLAALAAAIATGAAVGALSGWITAYIGANSFIITLGIATLVGGIVSLFSGDQTIVGVPQSLLNFGDQLWLGVPAPTWLLIAVAVLVLLHAPLHRARPPAAADRLKPAQRAARRDPGAPARVPDVRALRHARGDRRRGRALAHRPRAVPATSQLHAQRARRLLPRLDDDPTGAVQRPRHARRRVLRRDRRQRPDARRREHLGRADVQRRGGRDRGRALDDPFAPQGTRRSAVRGAPRVAADERPDGPTCRR